MMLNRDVIVIGASAGGVEALQNLVSLLPAHIPASIFIVLHMPTTFDSNLPQILSKAGPLPVEHGVEGQRFEHGRIYIAPPNRHMGIRQDKIFLSGGPRENGVRPAVDFLFRSAANNYGQRVAGVVLTGMLDDGTAGSRAIQDHGGITIVQDPNEAAFSGMPRNTIQHVEVDFKVPLAQIGPLLYQLATGSIEKVKNIASEEDQPREDRIRKTFQNFEDGSQPQNQTMGLTCPECGGVLWELRDGNMTRYACHLGHTYLPESLLVDQAKTVEGALWNAIRLLREREAFFLRLANRAGQTGRKASVHFFETQAAANRKSALTVEKLVESLQALPSAPEQDQLSTPASSST
jgi:two-component system, chemotaxis family, protein-glutamate methylesterase/glutaminase